LKALFEKEKLGFRQIKKIIEERINKILSFETYSYHIKKLKEDGYIGILNNDAKRGQKVDYCLTDIIKQEIDLGIFQFNHDKSYQQLQNIRERKKQIYYKILCAITIKPPLLTYNVDYEDKLGVTIEELSSEFSSVLEYWYIKLNIKIIKEALTFLEKEGLIKKLEIDNQYRYILAYDKLKDFVTDCITIFQNLITLRYLYSWRAIRRPKPVERRIYEMLWNKENITQQILNLNEIRKENKKSPHHKEILEKNRDWVDNFDFNIYHNFKQLESKYSELYIEYPTITNFILDVYYPKFLRDEIKNITNKNKNKKYPRALMAGHFYDCINIS
jgi:DNA-binding Lrp family transcriptional regulator